MYTKNAKYFPNIPNLQNCLFMYQTQHSPKLSASFPTLYAKDKYNYNTKSATQNLLNIPFHKNKYICVEKNLLKTFALDIGTI